MAEPITLSEAKEQLWMENDSSKDTFITSLIAPARAYVERVSGYYFVTGTKTATFTRWGDFLEIARRPITSITTVGYTDEDGNNATYTGFLVTLGNYSTRIYPAIDDDFPALAEGGLITVTYVAGALASTSEEYLVGKQAMLLLIRRWFNEEDMVGKASGDFKLALESLLDSITPVSAY